MVYPGLGIVVCHIYEAVSNCTTIVSIVNNMAIAMEQTSAVIDESNSTVNSAPSVLLTIEGDPRIPSMLEN